MADRVGPRRAGPDNLPKRLSLWHCFSRNAILRTVSHMGEFYGFERVFSMSQWERNQKPEGYYEQIHVDNLAPLVGPLSEMEVVARCAKYGSG